MMTTKTVLASLAAISLTVVNPAVAQATRPGDALLDPVAAASFDLSRASAPADETSEIGRRRSTLLILFFLLVAAGIILIADGDGSSDSPS